MAQLVSQSRMSEAEAQQALAAVDQQLAAHSEACAVCQMACDGRAFHIWRLCDVGRDLTHVQLQLQHRLAYLAMKARRRNRAEAIKGSSTAALEAVKGTG